MKKTYITPDTKVIQVSTCAVMQASFNATLDSNQTINDSESFGSRRCNIWDNPTVFSSHRSSMWGDE